MYIWNQGAVPQAESIRHWSLLQIRITFKNHELLRGVSWDVKKGERVGLVGTSHCVHTRSYHSFSIVCLVQCHVPPLQWLCLYILSDLEFIGWNSISHIFTGCRHQWSREDNPIANHSWRPRTRLWECDQGAAKHEDCIPDTGV